ncbi:hypothetical protein TrST_g12673 [Triparma strigata]|uniref:NAD(P)-binding protein n=1 Tax=Triparma strigata TaxID=1606541 RepID=A0A9W7EYT1_9STRA|nr:hypothetical protein TrST_g12673 [Triparma strigata]
MNLRFVSLTILLSPLFTLSASYNFLSANSINDRSYLSNKTVLITGPTSGLGLQVVKDLASLPTQNKPFKVILLARSESKAISTSEILKNVDIKTEIIVGDLSSPNQVFRMAEETKNLVNSIDVLIINAGMFSTATEREVQSDGLEKHFALNYLHQTILITQLLPLLTSPSSSRVCIMGSYTTLEFAKGKLDFSTLHSKEGKSMGGPGSSLPSAHVYSHAKLAQHMWAKHASKVMPKGVTINVACPGNVPGTNLDTWSELRSKIPRFLMPGVNWLLASRTVEVGVQPMMFIMGSSYMTSKTGTFTDWSWKKKSLQYFEPKPIEEYHNGEVAESVADPQQCSRLYDETEALMERFKEVPVAV